MLQILSVFLSLLVNNSVAYELHRYTSRNPWNYHLESHSDLKYIVVFTIITTCLIIWTIYSYRKSICSWFSRNTVRKFFGVGLFLFIVCWFSSNVDWNYTMFLNVFMLFILPVLFILICFFIWEWSITNRKVWKWFSDNLKRIAIGVLIAGFFLYFIGYSQQIKHLDVNMMIFSTLQAGGRALLSSLGMFVFDTDFIEVEEIYHHNIAFLILYAIIHLVGILVTTHVVLRLLGERFLSSRRMSRILNKNNKRDIYVFWGINEESLTLAGSIKEKYNLDKKKNIELLFVETPSEKELEIKEHSLSHFFNSSMHGSSEKDRIEELGGIILFPKRRLIDVDKEISESGTGETHFKKLGLNKLATLCERSKNTKFFLFSNDQKKNIQDTLIMREFLISYIKTKFDKIDLFFRARRNDVNIAHEEQNYIKGKNRIKVHIIDDSSLSVLSLKMKSECHPVRYVSINNQAQVTSEFNALILGFGQTGRDAFRFLYEFGTFPGEDKDKNEHEERSPLHITAIDKNMNEIEAIFRSKCPAIFQNHNKDRFELSSCDINSKDFFEQILLRYNNNGTKFIQNLNYIVVALGDDKTNLSVAMNLYRLIMRYKSPDAPRFTIYVRVYEINTMHEALLIQNYTKNHKENRIEFFGNPKELYTYDLIINDKVLKEAQIFAYIYNKGAKTLKTWNKKDEEDAKDVWDAKIDSITMDDNITDIKRQVEQDMSNSWHIKTKIHLIKSANIMDEVRDSWPGKRGEAKEKKEKENEPYTSPVKYDVSDNEQTIIDNIAICEHLRWNALSELQGYIPYFGPKVGNHKDFTKKELACLRPWKKPWYGKDNKDTLYGSSALIKYMKYDYNALDTSIYMNKNKM